MQRSNIGIRVAHTCLLIIVMLVSVLNTQRLAEASEDVRLTPSAFFREAEQRLQIQGPLSAKQISQNHKLDGHVRSYHPRILFANHGQDISQLLAKRKMQLGSALREYRPCSGGNTIALASCWLSGDKPDAEERLLQRLKDFKLVRPKAVGRYGNGWELALAYDLSAGSLTLSADDRQRIQTQLEQALRDSLTVLDGDSASLWHGRLQLASLAWICAVALDSQHSPERQALVTRAQGHFLALIKAVELTEAWPEGYNYWIQTRAFPFVLASAAYINGLKDAHEKDRVLAVLRRLGLWTIYATRPDNRIQGFGDEGSRVDLKDETRRVIDVIAQLTREPLFAAYSQYLEQLHGSKSYWGGYRWGFWLFNDPTVAWKGYVGRDLGFLDGHLPTAELFGPGAMNLGYIRSGWSPLDTFISFRAGDTFTHHGHYDAGHFTLFKGAPLAITSGTYGKFFGPHRLNYSIRTVATNSLLILRPGEIVRPNKKFFEPNVADGGQRIVIPTGSAIQSVADWAANRQTGKYYVGGRVLRYEHIEDAYTYVAADLTQAYNTPTHDEGGRGGKVTAVERELLYLQGEDRLIVHDHVVSTKPEFTKKWLLHTIERPELENANVLKGTAENGICQSSTDLAIVHNGESFLNVRRLYPVDGVIRLVGGPDYQFYVEVDGNDADLDGQNFNQQARIKPWFDIGMWRIEIQSRKARKDVEFLVALSPSLKTNRTDHVRRLELRKGNAKGLASPKSIVVFIANTPHGNVIFDRPANQQRLYLAGLPLSVPVTFKSGARVSKFVSSSEGVIVVPLSGSERQIALSW